MRTFSRAIVVAAGLAFIGLMSSAAFAGPLLVGTFTLSHPAQWNGTMLAAGEYQFKLTPSQTDANTLVVTGGKQSLSVLVFAHNACDSCKTVALKMTVQGDSRVITSMDLPGYHLDFKMPRTENAKDAASDSSAWVEQVSTHVDSAN